MKASLGIKIASIIACLALTAVGFASWLIIHPAEPKTSVGSFEVYEVEDNKVEITVTPTGDSKIIFGKPATTEISADWLYANDVANQVLTATFNVKVESKKGDATGVNLSEILSALKVEFSVEDTADGAYASAVAEKYIGKTTVQIDSAAGVQGDTAIEATAGFGDVATQEFVVTVTFAWGENFTSEGTVYNPYDYYNSQDYTPELGQDAHDALTAISAIENVKFNLKFSTVK